MPHIFTKDILRNAVERASNGWTTVLYDDLGYPSYMQKIDKFDWTNVGDLGTKGYGAIGTHKAFELDNIDTTAPSIYVGCYESSWMGEGPNSRLVSLPGRRVATGNFYTLLDSCFNKNPWYDGTNRCEGWHMMTVHEYSAVWMNQYAKFGIEGLRKHNILLTKNTWESVYGRKDIWDNSQGTAQPVPNATTLWGNTTVFYTGVNTEDLQNSLWNSKLGIQNLTTNALEWQDGILQIGTELMYTVRNYYWDGTVSNLYDNIYGAPSHGTTDHMWAVDETPSDSVLRKVRYNDNSTYGPALSTTEGHLIQSKYSGGYNDASSWFRSEPKGQTPGLLKQILIDTKTVYDDLGIRDGSDLPDWPNSERIFLKYATATNSLFLRGGDVYWNPYGGPFSFTMVYDTELFWDTSRNIRIFDLDVDRECDWGYHDQTAASTIDRYGHSNYFISGNPTQGIPSRNLVTTCRLTYISPIINTY